MNIASLESASVPEYTWESLREKWLACPLGHIGNSELDSTIECLSVKGIPDSHRRWVWSYILGPQRNKLARLSDSTYRRLVVMSDNEAPSSNTEVINGDVSRFQWMTTQQRETLRRILCAYDRRQSNIHYCHGMAEFCALLMPYMDEETTFWSMVVVIETLLPEYHVDSMVGFNAECLVLQDLLDRTDEVFGIHLREIGFSMHLICTKWFLSLFAISLPKFIVLRVYDLLFSVAYRGTSSSKIIIAMALSILLFMSDSLKKTDDVGEAMRQITEFCSTSLQDVLVAEPFMEFCNSTLETLSDELIDNLRSKHRLIFMKEMEDFESKKLQLRLEKASHVNKNTSTPLMNSIETSGSNDSVNHKKIDTSLPDCESYRQCLPSPFLLRTELPTLGLEKASATVNENKNNTEIELLWDDLRSDSAPKEADYTKIVSLLHTKGVPNHHRHWVWSKLLMKQRVSLVVESIPYSQLLINAESSENYTEIYHDVERMSHLSLDEKKSLINVLLSYSLRNSSIGYCQGINIIAATFLEYMSEEDAFWNMAVVLEVLLPEYHVESMIGLHTDCAVIQTMLRDNDPYLVQHFDDIGINIQMICTKWLIGCFITALPHECSMCILDIFFANSCHGVNASKVLIGVALTILLQLSDQLNQQHDTEATMSQLNLYLENLDDIELRELFLDSSRIVINALTEKKISEYRSAYRHQVLTNFTIFEIKRQEMRDEKERLEIERIFSEHQLLYEDAQNLAKRNRIKFSLPYKKTLGDILKRKKLQIRRAKENFSSSASVERVEEGESTDMNITTGREQPKNKIHIDELVDMGEKLRVVSELFNEGRINSEEKNIIKQRIMESSYGHTQSSMDPIDSSEYLTIENKLNDQSQRNTFRTWNDSAKKTSTKVAMKAYKKLKVKGLRVKETAISKITGSKDVKNDEGNLIPISENEGSLRGKINQ